MLGKSAASIMISQATPPIYQQVTVRQLRCDTDEHEELGAEELKLLKIAQEERSGLSRKGVGGVICNSFAFD
jgi:hypothetical protein